MKHTRVPRTVRRDIWRLAIETLSIPSLHIFSKPNSESDRKSNRKPENQEWTEPKIKSSNKGKNSTYLVPRWIITWVDWSGATFALTTNLLARIAVPRKFNLPYVISDQTSLIYANVVPTLISPTLYGLQLYSAVVFLQQRTKDTRTNNPQWIQ